MFSKSTIKSAFESMLYVWGNPLDVKDAAEVFNIDRQIAYEYLKELEEEYRLQNRGIMIRETDKKFQFCTKPENREYIEKLCTPVKEKRLSQSALEVLAIVAYRQPVTKAEIESIRGIKCDRVLEGLIKRELIGEKGKAASIGKPNLYGTTDMFLSYFGFKSLKDMPSIDSIEDTLSVEDENIMDGEEWQQIPIDLTQIES